jgi:tetratricopeptide (TPR) repeat protein
MARTVLDRAERLFSSARNAELIALLEPQVPVYRESARFYYLLGSACLRLGDSGGAATYLKRAESLSPVDADILLALAALEIRRGDGAKAVDYYLRALDARPGDRLGSRGLSILRTEGSPEGLAALVSSGRVAGLYPGARSLRPLAARSALALAAVAILALLWFGGSRLVDALRESRAQRPAVAAVSLSPAEREAPVSTGGAFRYVLTEAQVLSSFEKAKEYFQAYRDNAALIEINRILGSNASASVKAKAASLKGFVGKPDFRTLKDVPAYAEVARDPGLYDGCSVAWKGMAANVEEKDGSSRFDFLVGYQDKKRLEGIAKASIPDVSVPMDRPLELLATLSTSDGAVALRGAALHEMGASSR